VIRLANFGRIADFYSAAHSKDRGPRLDTVAARAESTMRKLFGIRGHDTSRHSLRRTLDLAHEYLT
jgi:hypothetical protein